MQFLFSRILFRRLFQHLKMCLVLGSTGRIHVSYMVDRPSISVICESAQSLRGSGSSRQEIESLIADRIIKEIRLQHFRSLSLPHFSNKSNKSRSRSSTIEANGKNKSRKKNSKKKKKKTKKNSGIFRKLFATVLLARFLNCSFGFFSQLFYFFGFCAVAKIKNKEKKNVSDDSRGK